MKKGKSFERIIFDPQTDLEIEYRDALIEMANYYSELENNTICGLTKFINVENSLLEEYTTRLITSFKEHKSIEEVSLLVDLYTRTDPKVAAQLIYESIVIFSQNKDLMFEHIANKCGYDLDDKIDRKEFLKNYLAVKEIEGMTSDIKTDDDLIFYLEVTKNFKDFYDNGLKKDNYYGKRYLN